VGKNPPEIVMFRNSFRLCCGKGFHLFICIS